MTLVTEHCRGLSSVDLATSVQLACILPMSCVYPSLASIVSIVSIPATTISHLISSHSAAAANTTFVFSCFTSLLSGITTHWASHRVGKNHFLKSKIRFFYEMIFFQKNRIFAVFSVLIHI